MIPADPAIDRIVDQLGCDRLAAVRHLQAREALRRDGRWLRRRWS